MAAMASELVGRPKRIVKGNWKPNDSFKEPSTWREITVPPKTLPCGEHNVIGHTYTSVHNELVVSGKNLIPNPNVFCVMERDQTTGASTGRRLGDVDPIRLREVFLTYVCDVRRGLPAYTLVIPRRTHPLDTLTANHPRTLGHRSYLNKKLKEFYHVVDRRSSGGMMSYEHKTNLDRFYIVNIPTTREVPYRDCNGAVGTRVVNCVGADPNRPATAESYYNVVFAPYTTEDVARAKQGWPALQSIPQPEPSDSTSASPTLRGDDEQMAANALHCLATVSASSSALASSASSASSALAHAASPTSGPANEAEAVAEEATVSASSSALASSASSAFSALAHATGPASGPADKAEAEEAEEGGRKGSGQTNGVRWQSPDGNEPTVRWVLCLPLPEPTHPLLHPLSHGSSPHGLMGSRNPIRASARFIIRVSKTLARAQVGQTHPKPLPRFHTLTRPHTHTRRIVTSPGFKWLPLGLSKEGAGRN